MILLIYSKSTLAARIPTDWGLGVQLQGTNSVFIGELTNYVPHYLSWGLNYEACYKSLNINGYMLTSWKNKTKEIIGSSPEIPNDYNSALTNLGFYIGYGFVNNDYFRISPNIGFSFTDIYPDDNETFEDVRLRIKPAISIGLNCDFKLFGITTDKCNSGYDYTYLRTRLSINKADMIDLYKGYMINFEIALGGIWSIKKKAYKR